MNDSAIMCDETIESYKEETKTFSNFNEKNVICTTQNFNILLAFLTVTIALLKAVTIYCYFIKY